MPDEKLIRNRDYLQQVKDFSGLRYGKITPTDIDAFLDFQNKLHIYVEVKYGKSQLSTGQRLALERICSVPLSCTKCIKLRERKVFVLVAHHSAQSDIDISSAIVFMVCYKGKWRLPKRKDITVRMAIDMLIERHLSLRIINGTKLGGPK